MNQTSLARRKSRERDEDVISPRLKKRELDVNTAVCNSTPQQPEYSNHNRDETVKEGSSPYQRLANETQEGSHDKIDRVVSPSHSSHAENVSNTTAEYSNGIGGGLKLTPNSSAKQSPVSHPITESPGSLSPGQEHKPTPQNGSMKGDASRGFVLKPLQRKALAAGPTCQPKAAVQPVSAPILPSRNRNKLKRQHSKEIAPNKPPKLASPSKTPQVPHNRLSFGEELDEEDAEPSSVFSLAQSTADRFHKERELKLPHGNGMASPFLVENFGSHKDKTLGPMNFGVAQARGPRPYMEDRYTIVSSYTPLSFTSKPIPDDVVRSFAAVYDGHNGSKAADHACARLHMVLAQEPALRTCNGEVRSGLTPWARQDSSAREAQEAADMGAAVKHAFEVVDGEILDRARAEQGRDGSTALVVLRIGEVIWAAHAGDSRAVLCRDGKAVRLTQDHKPELSVEKARVEAAGGKVDFQRCWRVVCPARNGRPASGLAVSRSFGDLDFKEPHRFIECEPDVTRLRATDEDRFVIMASDGLWDVVSDQESVDVVLESLAQSVSKGDSKAMLDARVKEAAETLLQHASKKGSMDNITVLLLLFQWH